MTGPTSVAETLRLARAKIEDPKHWTKGAYARPDKKSEDTVGASSVKAGAWCSVGVLRCVDGPHEGEAIGVLAEAITGRAGLTHGYAEDKIVEFNDEYGRRHRDVVRAFDKAIKLAESQA